MPLIRILPILIIGALLTACGTYVPSLRDWPNDNDADEAAMITQIVHSVRCELRYAVTSIVDKDLRSAPQRISRRRYTDFLNDWGVEVALNLTFVEKGSVNPTGSFLSPSPASAVLTLAGGAAVSSEATRDARSNVFYTVKQLYHPGRPNCEPGDGNRYGSPLVESNLRLVALLDGRISAAALGYADDPEAGAENVLSQTISFQIVTSGTLTPSVRLIRGEFNTGGGFLTASRDRKSEIVMTFGPMDRAKAGRSLIAIAEQVHITAQLVSSFRTALNP